MGTLFFLILIIAIVALIGIMPVFSAISAEKRPSPWVPAVCTPNISSYTNKSNVNAATPKQMNVDIPNVPVFDMSDISNVEIPEVDYMQASQPDIEGMENISKLLEETMVFTIANDIFEVESLSLPSLTARQYNSISQKFGEKVANLVTCTPYRGCMGSQVMLGQFFKEGNLFKFNEDFVELGGDVLEQFKKLDSVYLLVKGNFTNDGKFNVLHWEDPEKVAQGYSDIKNSQSAIAL